jgi:hypothetical protein
MKKQKNLLKIDEINEKLGGLGPLGWELRLIIIQISTLISNGLPSNDPYSNIWRQSS